MSTKPKLDDQTQAALSAIEEALKGSSAKAEPRLPEASSEIITVRRPTPENRSRTAPPPVAPKPAPAPAKTYAPAATSPTPSAASAQAAPEPRPAAEPAPRAVALAPTPAANDDREEIGTLLQAMQRKPSSRPFLAATFASILWTVAIGAFALSRLDLFGDHRLALNDAFDVISLRKLDDYRTGSCGITRPMNRAAKPNHTLFELDKITIEVGDCVCLDRSRAISQGLTVFQFREGKGAPLRKSAEHPQPFLQRRIIDRVI